LSAWQNFYVIVGSAGGALVGVQFVVIALVADTRRRPNAGAIGAFATPTVVHFGSALAVSAVMTAPWPSLRAAAAALAACGLGGLGYVAVVVRRTRRQTDYKPVAEDWVWYAILPGVAYAALAAAGPLLPAAEAAAFAVAGAALGLLFIGVHNAWDSVTHIVVAGPDGDGTKPE
jgi:hypothetical protein